MIIVKGLFSGPVSCKKELLIFFVIHGNRKHAIKFVQEIRAKLGIQMKKCFCI